MVHNLTRPTRHIIAVLILQMLPEYIIATLVSGCCFILIVWRIDTLFISRILLPGEYDPDPDQKLYTMPRRVLRRHGWPTCGGRVSDM